MLGRDLGDSFFIVLSVKPRCVMQATSAVEAIVAVAFEAHLRLPRGISGSAAIVTQSPPSCDSDGDCGGMCLSGVSVSDVGYPQRLFAMDTIVVSVASAFPPIPAAKSLESAFDPKLPLGCLLSVCCTHLRTRI